jgi:hypothetical protein
MFATNDSGAPSRARYILVIIEPHASIRNTNGASPRPGEGFHPNLPRASGAFLVARASLRARSGAPKNAGDAVDGVALLRLHSDLDCLDNMDWAYRSLLS